MLFRFDRQEPVVGTGAYVSETAQVIGDVRIGSNCYIGHGVILRGDYGSIEIGDETAVEEGVIVHAPPQNHCSIGNRVTIGHGAIIHGRRIGDSVTVGMGAILSIRSEVGTEAIVAEGAVVGQGQKIPESIVAGGNPARKLREVNADDREFGEWVKRLYIDLAHKYLELGMERIDVR